MKQKIIKTSLLLLSTLPFSSIEARQPYHATATVDTTSVNVSAPNISDLSDDLKTSSLETLAPIYTPTSPLSININLRGIDVIASFAANSTTLVVQIPDTGANETFSGATRDDSVNLFKEYVKDGGGNGGLLKAYARYSPIDPIAGNPNSLMAIMAQSDYLLGQLDPLSGCDCESSIQPIVHEFQASVTAGRVFSKGFDGTTVHFPLRYSYSPSCDWALIIDTPVTYIRNGGASSLVGSLGIGWRYQLTPGWSLTSVIRGGVGGSSDLCTAGSFVSCGLTSVYDYPIGNFTFTLLDYAGYFTSTNLWMCGDNFNYHLHNYVLKNGVSVVACRGFVVCNREFQYSLSIEDTCFLRDHLFLRHFDEVAVSLMTTGVNSCLDYDCLSVTFTYQFGQKDYRGYMLNLAYLF